MKQVEKFKFTKFLDKYLRVTVHQLYKLEAEQTKNQQFKNLASRRLAVLNNGGFSRNNSPCPNSQVCGSCPISHIPYSLQLEIKMNYVKALLDLIDVDKKVLDKVNIIPSVPNSHYRNRMDFAVDIKGRLGLKAKGSWHTIIPHHKCFLASRSIEKAFDVVEQGFQKFKVVGYDRKAREGFLSFVVIRGDLQGNVSVNYVVRKDVISSLTRNNKLVDYMESLGQAAGFIVKAAKKQNIAVVGGTIAVTNSLREESNGDIVFSYKSVGLANSLKTSQNVDDFYRFIQLARSNFPTYLTEVASELKKGLIRFSQGFLQQCCTQQGNSAINTSADISSTSQDGLQSDLFLIVEDFNGFLPDIPVVINGVKYGILPFSFFQPNLYTAGILQQVVGFYAMFFDQITASVGGFMHSPFYNQKLGDLRILDLFGGQGFLGGFIAKTLGASVDVIEVDEDAIVQGVKLWQKYISNIKIMKISDINRLVDSSDLTDLDKANKKDEQAATKFRLADGSGSLHLIAADAYNFDISDVYDVIILDPPRRGLTKKLIRKLLKLQHLKRIIYVSCNIKQFALEYSKHLSKLYRLEHIILLDQFPHTEHLEAVLVLDKKWV